MAVGYPAVLRIRPADDVNSMHGVTLKEAPQESREALPLLASEFRDDARSGGSRRAYGGGILKMEPRQAAGLPVPWPAIRAAWSSLRDCSAGLDAGWPWRMVDGNRRDRPRLAQGHHEARQRAGRDIRDAAAVLRVGVLGRLARSLPRSLTYSQSSTASSPGRHGNDAVASASTGGQPRPTRLCAGLPTLPRSPRRANRARSRDEPAVGSGRKSLDAYVAHELDQAASRKRRISQDGGSQRVSAEFAEVERNVKRSWGSRRPRSPGRWASQASGNAQRMRVWPGRCPARPAPDPRPVLR